MVNWGTMKGEGGVGGTRRLLCDPAVDGASRHGRYPRRGMRSMAA